jgi:hypothetical protein
MGKIKCNYAVLDVCEPEEWVMEKWDDLDMEWEWSDCEV